MSINVLSYGAVGDGVTDDTAALQAAINDAYLLKTWCYFPAGEYLTGTLVMPYNSGAAYNQGNYLVGDGVFASVLKARSNNTEILQFTQTVNYNWQYGGAILGMRFDANGKTGCIAIRPQGLFSYEFSDLFIMGGFSRGFSIKNQGTSGDMDASNHLIFSNCRIENCSAWGIFLDVRSGNNEVSFMTINNTTIQSCGTVAGAVGGGMYWRGQMLEFNNSAFVECQNRGLYIEGGAGLGSNILGNNLCFENCGGMNIQCYGITGMEFNQLQMYNGNFNIATAGIWLNAQSTIANVRVNSAKIRTAASLTPFTAFFATGANLSASTVVVDSKQVRWDLFGSAGQTQYSGWTVV